MAAPPVELSRQRRGLAALVALMVLIGLTLLVAASVGGPQTPDTPPATTPPAPTPPATSPTGTQPPEASAETRPAAEQEALAVLRGWDSARSRAWARADVAALGRLYVPGSPVAERDRALLAQYVGRGLSVRGLEMQVLEVRTLRRTGHVMVLRVTDRLVGGVAVGRDRRLELPRDAASTRVLRFVRRGQRWLVAAVRLPARS